jgi:hypothetical protein
MRLAQCLLLLLEWDDIMTTTQRERESGKPLGDSGTGASGGGSIGNLPGGAATGGEPRQGVRSPDSGTAREVDNPAATESGTDQLHRPSTGHAAKHDDKSEQDPQTASEKALPSTQDKNPRQ